MLNFLLRLVALIFCSISIVFSSAHVAAEDHTIRLGYMLDLSAKGAFMGVQSQAGAELAQRELTTAGARVKIIFEDHRTDAKAGAAIARKLLTVDQVDAVLCDLTPACIAASPIVSSAKKVLMYQSGIISILATNPYAFKNYLDYEDGCRQIGSYWKKQGVQRVAHFKVNAEFGDLCLDGARDIYPSQDEFEYDPNTDLRALVTRVKHSGVLGVFQTGYEADYINRLRASADIGLSASTGMPETLLTDSVIQAVSRAAIEGTVTFGFPHISPEFIGKLKAAGLYRSAISIESAAIAYLHVQQLVASINACPARDIDCQVARIAASPADQVLGFKGWKDRAASYDFKLRRWQNGKFIDISATASGRATGHE